MIDTLCILLLTITLHFHLEIERLPLSRAESLQNVRGWESGLLRDGSQLVKWVELHRIHGRSFRRSLDDNASLSKEALFDGTDRMETRRANGSAKERWNPPSQHQLFEIAAKPVYLF